MVFKDDGYIYDLLEKPNVAETKFLMWMEYNKHHPEAHEYLYVEFPRHCVWNSKDKG